MASTYVDNFTIVDVENTQVPSATQYNSDEGAGTLNPDLYAATSATVHTIPTGLRSFATGAITDDGYSQKSLYEALLKIQVNFDTAMMSLDDSAGVADTDYESLCSLGSLAGTYNIHPNGIGTPELATYLQAIATKLAVLDAKLDLDATITDTDYHDKNILFTAKTGALSLLDAAFDITANGSFISKNGIDQGALVDFLNTAVTNINALWVKLDADI